MQFPYLNKTKEVAILRADGLVYANQWTSWRLTAHGSVIYRVVRRYLCGHSNETFRNLPSKVALASDEEHRNAMLVVLAREAGSSPFDRRHMFHPHCHGTCTQLDHHEPKAIQMSCKALRPVRAAAQRLFAWAALG